MSTSTSVSTQPLSHSSNCDCTFCQNHAAQQPEQVTSHHQAVASMPSHDRNDYFDDKAYDTVSDSESERHREEKIRQAPYLPRVQVWARNNGPYTLRVGNQWFHCDDLIVNGAEYRQKSRKADASSTSPANQAAYSAQKPRRPASSRAQSYQRTRPEKQPTSTANTTNPPQRLAAHDQYQPQSLPAPKDSDKRKAEHRRHKETDDAPRERRDSGTAMMDQPSYGALVTYTHPPPSQAVQPPRQAPAKAGRPGLPRRASSRNNSYQRPVRKAGKKHVRFASTTE
ncbi:hypothetical protein LTR64_002023 [Lithohypha guttulata]|uniref:Uncharacterized protein n=1 Tax=Lithohypha guttulata TaxID=1690604 RepID=A0AAN7SU49_9EURO|nr:hypothetical protein LTR51_007882 [Lithohypha guttulata]KAK5081540.1 hypothetical protein LTR05_007671 [Lithohypha guttulata]